MTEQEFLAKLEADLTGFIKRADEEFKTAGTVNKETKDAITSLTKRIDELDVKIATKAQTVNQEKSLQQVFQENDSLQRLMKDRRGTARIQLDEKSAADLLDVKTTVTTSTVGFPTVGVMPVERGRYVEEARRPLRMRDVIPSRATTLARIYWPKASTTGTKGSPISEAGSKPENYYTPTTAQADVETIATWIPASRQVLEDWTELMGILRSLLGYKIDYEEDLQILSGSGVSPNLNGLTTQATAWDLTLLTASDGYEYIDMIAGACKQIAGADELPPTFFVVHPYDWWKMKMTKDTTGRYILGDPTAPYDGTLWGLRPIPTTAMTQGYFLAGNGTAQAAEVRDRMGLEIEISTEHSTYFTSNLVAIRAEKRSALCVYRPAAFIYGALTQSPA